MKRTVTYTATFSPTTSTLDLSAIPSFNIQRLYAVLDLTNGSVLYAAGTFGYGYTGVTNGVLTLQASMAGAQPGDALMIIYDDGDQASASSFVKIIMGSTPISSSNRLPIEIDAESAGLALDTSLQAINALIGTQGAGSPTLPGSSTGLLGYLRLLASYYTAGGIAVTAPGIINPSASFSRPANTTQYGNGYIVANSATAGSVNPMVFSVARAAGKSVKIRRGRLIKSTNSLTSAIFKAYLYNTAPTLTAGDGNAWSGATGSATAYCGSLEMSTAMDKVFSDGSALGMMLPTTGTEMDIATASVSTNIYAILATGATGSTYTPGSGETFTLTLEVEQL